MAEPRPVQLLPAIIVGVFTLLGVVLGSTLDRWVEREITNRIERQEVMSLLARRAQGRYFRARNLLQVANSSRFSARWEDYIENGVFAWNEDLAIIEIGVDRYLPRAKGELQKLEHDFAQLNDALVAFHRSGGQPGAQDQEAARQALEEVELDIENLRRAFRFYID